MTSRSIPPLIEQLRAARTAYLEAHTDAEGKIAAAATLKLAVGSNADERKRQAAAMDAEEYSGYVLHLAEAEKEKAAAVAHLERCEKTLNVLREELSHEAAEINLRAADRLYAAQERAAETAEKYRQMPGNHTMASELRARWPLQPIVDDDPEF